MNRSAELFILKSAQENAVKHFGEMKALFSSYEEFHGALMELEQKGLIQDYSFRTVDGYLLVNHNFTLTSAGYKRLAMLKIPAWRRCLMTLWHFLRKVIVKIADSWIQSIVLAILAALGGFILSRF